MATEETKGRYMVFRGAVPGQHPVGRIEQDEFVRSFQGEPVFRFDGDSFYDMAGNYLGEITQIDRDYAEVVDRQKNCLFVIVAD